MHIPLHVILDHLGLATANLLPVCVIMILTFSAICPPLTNTIHPCTLAIPSPFLPICVMFTSYSLPTWSCIASVEPLSLLLLLLFCCCCCCCCCPFPKLVRGGGV